jgi:hypothetical protein
MTAGSLHVEDVLSALRQRLDRHAPAADPLLRAEAFLEQLAATGAGSGAPAYEVAEPAIRLPVPEGEAAEDSGDALSDWDWVGRIQKLTPMPRQRQVECALEIEAGVIAAAVLDGTETTEVRCSQQELQALVAQGARAYEEMALGNLRLVLHWARVAARGDRQALQENHPHPSSCTGLLGGAPAHRGRDAGAVRVCMEPSPGPSIVGADRRRPALGSSVALRQAVRGRGS